MEFIIQNIGTIIALLVVLLVVAAVVVVMAKDKKKGKSSCGCNCANCPMSGKCHTK